MALSLEQIKEHLKAPTKKSEIAEAINHELRLRFHTEPILDAKDIKVPTDNFLKFVEDLLPSDKVKAFKSLLRFPIPTVELVGKIYGSLEKVFNSGDSAIEYNFTNSELKADWEYYRQEVLMPNIWRVVGWEKLKSCINSILIIDLPLEQQGDRPSPYLYWLSIASVVDYECRDNCIDWIMFNQEDGKLAVFDQESYRVFNLNDKSEITSILVESKHNLGYCPATFFWSTPISQSKPYLKESPLTKELTSLDWLLFFMTAKKQLDISGAYPIYSAYKEDCYYRDVDGNQCENGYIVKTTEDNKTSSVKCPECSKTRTIGPGTIFSVPAPMDREDPDLRDPISMLSIDKGSLEYNRDEVTRLADVIYSSVTGGTSIEVDKQAINEKQVSANFEGKTAVLNSIKTNFERAQKFADDTICKLRYAERFIGSSINWGSKFYLYTTEDLYAKYKLAKENGANESELDATSRQIIETEHKNTPSQLQRMLILRELEPLRHKTLEEVITLRDKGLLNDDMVRLKINFSSLIDRFERESINVVAFGANLSMDIKIKTITTKLLEYVRENSNTSKREPDSNT